MNFNVDRSSIVCFLNGEMPNAERKELEKWIYENEDNLKYFNEIKTIYDAAHGELNNIAQTDREWQRLVDRINFERKKRFNLFKLYRNVAAILLIPLLGLGLFYYYGTKSDSAGYGNMDLVVVTPAGQKSELILPDSTRVWLNSGSRLSYSSFGADGVRKVNLEGEGYFEVKKDSKHPFIVSTKDYNVKVLGTKFNVRSYAGDGMTETLLEEGKVAISFSDGRRYELIPGQMASGGDKGKLKIENVKPENVVCWKNNVLRFNNTPLREMAPMLEHWYGVKINVKNMDKVAGKRFTMTIKTESLKETLQLMKYVIPLKYSINGENVEIVFLDI